MQLLDKNVKTRLGAEGGVDDVIAHPFFSDLDIKKLLKKEVRYLLSVTALVSQIESTFKPKLSGDRYDVTNFD